jgi:glycosyltransferase involved in cell wall biosynthesis
MTAAPRLSIGLPVYNGERYLAEALDSLLGQSYENFELIISDNASADATADICRCYGQQDSRIRYFRQPQNIGLSPNHNFVFEQSRGELFKWAASDDLYARDLLKHCIEALDEYPDIALAHCWTAIIDSGGNVTEAPEYPLATDSPSAPERFRSFLSCKTAACDQYGVIRAEVMRRVSPLESYHHADVIMVARLVLQGPFYEAPDWLTFRRDYPERAYLAYPKVRIRCVNHDPRRANPLKHPAVRLLAEYMWGYVTAIRDAPLSPADRRECYRHLAQWVVNWVGGRVGLRRPAASAEPPAPVLGHRPASVHTVVADQEGRAS